jgi:hypothetical protein
MLWRTVLPRMVVTTLVLLAAVVVVTVVLGAGLAWLVGGTASPGIARSRGCWYCRWRCLPTSSASSTSGA